MAASKEDISGWFDKAKADGMTHLIIVCDTFDWDDYPVYVGPDEDVRKKEQEFSGPNMQKVMEVYSMKLDKDMQMREHRSFHYD